MRKSSIKGFRPQFGVQGWKKIVALSVLTAVLSGCRHGGYQEFGGYLFTDYGSNHPIAVRKKSKNISITVRRGAHGLTKRQSANVRRFLSQYANEGEGALFISAPNGGPTESEIYDALQEVRELVRLRGISHKAVHFSSYDAYGDPTPSVRMSFNHYIAEGPDCGHWPTNLARNRKNLPYPNFGCAQQRNLAAMVVNPRDLIKPQETTPRSSERRDVTWDKFIKGESTESAESRQSSSSLLDKM